MREFSSRRIGRLSVALASLAILATCGIARADDVADFYAGKQINLILGFGPGGSNTIYGQVVARHLGRFLPGNPSIVTQHMPAGAGVAADNFIANTAPRDGTAIALSNRTTAIQPLLGDPNTKFDARKFGWIGTANIEYSTCFSWHTSPVRTLADAMQRSMTVGGTGADSTDVVYTKAANELTGTKFQIVMGYPGSNDVNLAIERGELEGNCALGWTLIKNLHPAWLSEHKLNLLFQIGLRKHPDLPDVPLIIDHARTPEGRKIFEFLFAPQDMGRPFFAPPGLPPARLQALRAAFDKTLHDPVFLADATKSGVDIQFGGGEDIQTLVDRVYETPPAVIDRVKAIMR